MDVSQFSEVEDVELAMALSLSEMQSPSSLSPPPSRSLPPAPPVGRGVRPSGSSSSGTRNVAASSSGGRSFSERTLSSVFGSTCVSCGSPCWFERVTVDGRTFCRRCLRCHGCGESLEGPFVCQGDGLYCQTCALTLLYKECSVCGRPLSGTYLSNPFFEGETYCVEHRDNAIHCFSW